MKNQKDLYPKPPFKRQTQDFPGLESILDPKPNYGLESYKPHGKLKGKTAIITGGDSGIGRATAFAFAAEGAEVAISYLPQEESDAVELQLNIEAIGGQLLLIPGDITDEAQCEHIVAKTLERFGKIDILVNNAAFQKNVRGVEDINEELLEQTYRTNIYAPLFLIKGVWNKLKSGGSIINVSSIQAYNPSPWIMIYASTKAALSNLTISVAEMGAEKGIRVNAVAPGPIWTPLNTIDPPKKHVENFGGKAWLKRPGQPIEVAKVIVFLASDDASYVTGHIYGVTGGMEMGI